MPFLSFWTIPPHDMNPSKCRQTHWYPTQKIEAHFHYGINYRFTEFSNDSSQTMFFITFSCLIVKLLSNNHSKKLIPDVASMDISPGDRYFKPVCYSLQT